MDLQLAGDVAVVFGAARGIGRAIAAAFAAEGARVVLSDVSAAAAAAAELAAGGVDARAEVADATDPAAVAGVAARTIAAFGRVDHVVYAAGAGSGKYGFPFWA